MSSSSSSINDNDQRSDSSSVPASASAEVAESLAFRAARIARLTAESGWLAVVQRYPLDIGENQIPIGTVTLDRSGLVNLIVAPGLAVTCEGEPVSQRTLRADGDGGPDPIRHGRLTYELIRRGDNFAIRVRDPESPLRRNFPGTSWYPPRPDWKRGATFEPFPEERLIDIPYEVGPVLSRSPGRLMIEIAGQGWPLDALMDDERKRLFILFGDETNRDETYGAGRFLYTPLPDPSTGRVVVDFNQALNPACAFTEFVACPLPPPQNRLPFRIEAGEKRYHSP